MIRVVHPGSALAVSIRIRIQDSQINADPDPQHWSWYVIGVLVYGTFLCNRFALMNLSIHGHYLWLLTYFFVMLQRVQVACLFDVAWCSADPEAQNEHGTPGELPADGRPDNHLQGCCRMGAEETAGCYRHSGLLSVIDELFVLFSSLPKFNRIL